MTQIYKPMALITLGCCVPVIMVSKICRLNNDTLQLPCLRPCKPGICFPYMILSIVELLFSCSYTMNPTLFLTYFIQVFLDIFSLQPASDLCPVFLFVYLFFKLYVLGQVVRGWGCHGVI